MRRLARTDNVDAHKLEAELRRDRAETRAADLAWAMSDARGRRLFHELLYDPTTGLGFDEAPWHGNSSQFGEAAKRQVAKLWVDRMKAEHPDFYLLMLGEALETNQDATFLREKQAQETQKQED